MPPTTYGVPVEQDIGGSWFGRKTRQWLGRQPVLWESHAVGERLLVEELEALRSEGYELYHDRRLEPGSKEIIDTIVVGPPGVYLFDAKHWWGRVFVENNQLVQERRYRRERTGDIDKLLFAAKRVGQVTHTYIHPFLVLTGEAQMDSGGFISKVRVRDLAGTANLLRTQIQTLSLDDVHRIGRLVEDNFAHHEAKVDPSGFGPRPAEGGGVPSDRQARGLISVPSLPGAGFLRRNKDEEMRPSAAPLGYYLRHPFSAASRSSVPAPQPREYPEPEVPRERRNWRPGYGTVLLGMLALTLLVFYVADPGGLRAGATGCALVDDAAASKALGQQMQGGRRLRGGCTLVPTEDGEGQKWLVWRGSAAQRRADGAEVVTVRREDCGVLVVAPEGSRLPGVRESAAERATPAAACLPAGTTTTPQGRTRAAAAAAPLLSAVRKDAVAEQ